MNNSEATKPRRGRPRKESITEPQPKIAGKRGRPAGAKNKPKIESKLLFETANTSTEKEVVPTPVGIDAETNTSNYYDSNTHKDSDNETNNCASNEKSVPLSTTTEVVEETAEKQTVSITPNTDFNNVVVSWKRCQVFADEQIPESEPLLMIGEQIFLCRDNIATIIGKPKCYKTFLTSSFAGAFLSSSFMNLSTPKKNGKILFLDTEQGKARTQKVQQRINLICGLDIQTTNDNLIMLSVREFDASKRLEILKEAVADNKPDLVLIDGIRDLLVNFNDVEDSNDIVNEMMKLSTDFNCGIITVIHQNKGDANARGHLGSELMNKSQSVIEMRKSGDIGTARPLHCRDIEFASFSFSINEQGVPQQCGTPTAQTQTKEEQLQTLIEDAFDDTDTLTKDVLLQSIMQNISCSKKTADRRIKDAVEVGLIEELPNKMYQLKEQE